MVMILWKCMFMKVKVREGSDDLFMSVEVVFWMYRFRGGIKVSHL